MGAKQWWFKSAPLLTSSSSRLAETVPKFGVGGLLEYYGAQSHAH